MAEKGSARNPALTEVFRWVYAQVRKMLQPWDHGAPGQRSPRWGQRETIKDQFLVRYTHVWSRIPTARRSLKHLSCARSSAMRAVSSHAALPHMGTNLLPLARFA